MLSAQRERFDGLFLEAKTWSFAVWRKRNLDHPLVGLLARALIWRGEQPGRPARAVVHEEEGFVDAHARPVELVESEASVSLWHPLGTAVNEVLAWRRRPCSSRPGAWCYSCARSSPVVPMLDRLHHVSNCPASRRPSARVESEKIAGGIAPMESL